jgi:Leucine-rich repeat (LRR) protein
LTNLPELPSSLQMLYCDKNQLTEIPELPYSLQRLYCEYNRLTNLPELKTSSLQRLYCSNNPFYNELGYELTIETLPRYIEEQNNLKMIDYIMK